MNHACMVEEMQQMHKNWFGKLGSFHFNRRIMRLILGKSVMKVSNELNSLIISLAAQNVLSMNCP